MKEVIEVHSARARVGAFVKKLVGKSVRTIAEAGDSAFARRVGILASATVLAQMVTLFVSPVLTRLYSPADFGRYSVFTSLAALLASVMSLRFETAILVAEEENEAVAVVHLSLLISMFLSCIAVFAAILLPARLSPRIGIEAQNWLLTLVPIAALLTASFRVMTMWVLRFHEYRRFSTSRISQSITSAVVQVALGLSTGASGLVAGLMASNAVGVAMLVRSRQLWRARTDKAVIVRMLREHRRFALFSTPSSLLNSIVLYLPALALAALFGPAVAGMFALAHRLMTIPLATVGQALTEGFLTGFAERKRQKDVDGMRRLFKRSLGAISAVSIVLIGSLALAGPSLFALVFGPEWMDAGRYVRLLSPMYLLGLIASPFGGVLELLNRQDLFLARESARVAVVIGSLVIAGTLGLNVTDALLLLGVAGAAAFAFSLLLAWQTLAAYSARELVGTGALGAHRNSSPEPLPDYHD